jgi:hypothetical protein
MKLSSCQKSEWNQFMAVPYATKSWWNWFHTSGMASAPASVGPPKGNLAILACIMNKCIIADGNKSNYLIPDNTEKHEQWINANFHSTGI